MVERSVRSASDRENEATIVEVSHWMGDKIYYLEFLRASEGTLSCWPRLHLRSLASTPVLKRVDVRQAAGRKSKCRILIKTCCTDPT
jgi:hypothetical protein